MKTYSQKPKEVSRSWYVIDAASAPLGRVATSAASLLLGKAKTTITSHIDGGDFVIIINADKLVTTGGKEKNKIYYRHSGFPGGIYSRTLQEQQKKDATKVLYIAVRGMLPDNKLRRGRLERLKIYSGTDHSHGAQKPVVMNVKGSK